MFALHAMWNNVGKFHLWAEDSNLPSSPPKRRGKRTRKLKARPHPFTLDKNALLEAAEKVFFDLPENVTGFENIMILLPSTVTGPLPSPKLIREDVIGEKNAIGLAPWQVETIVLDPGCAMDLLLSLPSHPPRGMVFGSSLCFWEETAKFSVEQIVKQRFIPSIQKVEVEKNISYQATWVPAVSEEDFKRVRLLAEAMPPVCRALLSNGGALTSPQEMILGFMNKTVDAFIRRTAASASPIPPRRGRRSKTLPLQEQWLHALFSQDPTFASPNKEMQTFTNEMQSWLHPIQALDSDAPFRTCFRLEEPPDDGEDTQEWRVSFHLQAKADQSLLIPAETVWKTRSGVLTFLKRRFENPQERLLADLGRASRLFPVIERSLQAAHPEEVKLNTEQAYSFLSQSAPLLDQSGFGVLLPPWWQKPSASTGIRLKVKPKKSTTASGSGLFGLGSIVEYDWEIALGDETLSPDEFEKLAVLKIPLVRVRGQWVELRQEDIEKAIAFFKEKHGNGEISLGEAMQLGLGQEGSETGLPVVDVQAEGWVGNILGGLSGGIKFSAIKTPKSFRGTLRPYQIKGLSWLDFHHRFGLGSCLADDMGLGKTIQLIALMLQERRDGRGRFKPGSTLLFCPMSVVGNWQREVERFAPSLKVMVHHGGDRLTGRAFKNEAKKHDLVITTFALAKRDEKDLSAVDWHRIVLDETQNIKNPFTKQTQAIIRLKADHRIALTGTPVENRLSELWSIMEFLNPGYLGTAKDFRNGFVIPIEKYRDSGRAETLRRLIQPFILRRLKTDPTVIKDLPKKMEMKVFCNLTLEQASLYKAVVAEMLGRIEQSEGIERKGLVLATLMKLKQICNHPAQFLQDGSTLPDRSGKLARLTEMLEEALAEGDKALIFTQFAQMGIMLRHHLQETFGCETLFLHGGTRKRQRDAMVSRFQEGSSGPSLFVLSLKAGGFGLNLTAANRVFHFDRWWNPAVENQATDRAFRIGQKKNVQVHKFVCIGTLEERIDQLVEQKMELAENIVGSGEAWLTELSTEQLKEMFALSRDVVGGE